MERSSKMKFLQSVDSGGYSSLFTAFLFSCGSSYLLKRNISRIGFVSQQEVEKIEHNKELALLRNRYYVMLSRLKKDKILSPQLTLTQKGKKFLNSFSFSVKKYEKYKTVKSSTITLITFDIPEKFRKHRSWLRGCLKNMGFEMLQRSVWIGKVKVPVDFIDSLRFFRLIKYIEILEISKVGSIEKVLK